MRTKFKNRRKSDKVSLAFNERASVNNNPSVTAYSTIYPLKSHDKRWIGSSSRQDAIEQQTALKAVAIGHTRQLAQPYHSRRQTPFRIKIARTSRWTPRQLHKPPQRYNVLNETEQYVHRKQST